jgi:predicted lipoprotein with Yx(FWY)xxD motif
MGLGLLLSIAALAAGGTGVQVVDSEYGQVVADRRGEALYLFARETDSRSRCYGTCARAWPPVLVRGAPVAEGDAAQELLGTTRRRNGRLQLTYAGNPLYRFVYDSPGEILCHDVAEFGGRWLVVTPSGMPAT